ncbi:hypothetical protein BDD12DRAFT_855499 [Trichophaea hybrida]|nr:hypothetical protein BDD12DRAFT_855499 [Trichophaea hybrida]
MKRTRRGFNYELEAPVRRFETCNAHLPCCKHYTSRFKIWGKVSLLLVLVGIL